MGVIANAQKYLVKKVTDTTSKAADGVARAAVLSPQQVQRVNEKRNAYLSKKKDMQGDEAQEFIRRKLGSVGIEVYQAYLEQLKTFYQPMDAAIERFDALNRIRYFDISKWVTDPTEKSLDKLVNVYQVLSEENCNIALIFDRKRSGCRIVMAVSNTDMEQSDPAKANSFCARLATAIKGNFPGVEILEQKNDNSYGCGIPACLEDTITVSGEEISVKSVAVVSNLASDKSEDFISQSMEKLLDGIVPESDDEEYTIVLLAKPILDQLNAQNRLFELYSDLAPYSSWQTNYTHTVSDMENSSATVGVNLGMNIGKHWGNNTSISSGAQGVVVNEGVNSGIGIGANFGVNFARSSSVTVQVGENEGITQNYINYGVKHTLDVIAKQLERIDSSSALGMWEFASYVFAKSPVITNNVAHMYLALTQGNESYMTRSAINLWDGQEEKDAAETILKSVQKLHHPVFGLKDSVDETTFLFPSLVTPSAILSGKELAKALNFPRKSVSGLPVYECVPFGREVVQYAHHPGRAAVPLGHVYHMRREENATVALDKDSLTAHVFITGSTGAGKSNTIYTMLDRLCLVPGSTAKFLVIEPAKGEYKEALGGYEDVRVYGTNPYKTPLLRLNPFSFPEDTHVLEHIDRLIEIFNACWPMYAAMPAVLKAAVERAYRGRGWNLSSSRCAGTRRFPTFWDVMRALPEVVNSKGFSNDTQGDYKGALLTRLESLTNGINGQVLCAYDELDGGELFDQNVIVDLSRVGSSETKALLMGTLILKLQEHRMAQRTAGANHPNSGLQHITVLEEAHNLLRRTSTEQSQESSNLQGKSVEMLTNAIAEMRTYGEGFLIADQSPGLLDMAVIRNTNTKLILRLPDEGDRLLVGKAAGLNDDQIVELSRLDTGVAAVYQNHWLEPVLCKVEHFKGEKPYEYVYRALSEAQDPIHKFLMRLFAVSDDTELAQEDVDAISRWIDSLDADAETNRLMYKALKNGTITKEEQRTVAYNLFEGKQMAGMLENSRDEAEGIRCLDAWLLGMEHIQDEALAVRLRQLVLQSIVEYGGMEQFKSRYAVYAVEGRLP